MAICIKCGSYNKKYKYMIFYILIMLPLQYFFGDLFPDEMKLKYLRSEYYPKEIFIIDIFNFLGIIIFGLILSKVEKKLLQNKLTELDNLSDTKPEIQLIHNKIIKKPTFKIRNVLIVITLYVINYKLIFLSNFIFALAGLDFWSIEIAFLVYFNVKLFKNKLYIHQKIAVGIIIIMPTLMQIFAIIATFKDDDYKIFKVHKWLVPIGIIGFLLLYFAQAFLLYKTKWYFEFKFISEKEMLIYLGIIGFIIFFVLSMIINFFQCPPNDFSSLSCTVYKNESERYFDNFSIFFGEIWKNSRKIFFNFVYIFIVILKILFTALNYYFAYLIIKVLNPIFLYCSNSIMYLIVKTIFVVYKIIKGTLDYDSIFDLLSEFFNLLGIIIYLELIELNFCNLNRNLKKNIKERANFEIYDLLSDNNDNETVDDKESEYYGDIEMIN